MEWNNGWPQKEGLYWAYGYIYKRGEKLLKMVRVVKIANKRTIYILEGNFFYKSEAGGDIKWQPVVLPNLPEC